MAAGGIEGILRTLEERFDQKDGEGDVIMKMNETNRVKCTDIVQSVLGCVGKRED